MESVYKKDGTLINLLQDVDISSGDNYIYFPDGTLICKGSFGVNGDGASRGWLQVHFPAEFKDKLSSITITNIYSYNDSIVWNLGDIDEYGFKAYYNCLDGSSLNSNQIASAFYVAIGRWK